MEISDSSRPPDPAQLAFESGRTRRLIIASYWITILLALPLWWTTTSIERKSLPAARVFAQQHRELIFPIHVHLNSSDSSIHTATLAQEVQNYLDTNAELQHGSGLHITISPNETTSDGYQVLLERGEQEPMLEKRSLHLAVHPEVHDSSSQMLAMEVADTLATLISPYTTLRSPHAERVVSYAPRYRLAFTLLNEDAASDNAALSWDVRESLSRHIQPVLDRLSMLHNFTIESQVQFHAPLAFQPRTIHHNGQIAYGLTQEDLTVFINSAEWTLSSSVSNDPVLHFIMFVPSSRHSPLYILGDNAVASSLHLVGSPLSSNAFILPQWGGIVLFNPPSTNTTLHLPASALNAIFATFHRQLKILLGVPALPAYMRPRFLGSAGITDWQLDTLTRRRAAENAIVAQGTLESTVRLVSQIGNMPVGQDVKGDVQEALTALEKAHEITSSSSASSLQFAGKASALASRAFFNPGMLALLYFPAEHKFAVYTPLFASIAAPLVAAVIRELLTWRKARRLSIKEKTGANVERPKAE
ncbi:uncharacterized protein LAESUDRAFT_713904 [Laetiporus sulphureus 93-53]|uniref:GPI transamidase component PIG-S n=1 Tax=Laetiporus sulphureus 93-53 TaxID=1314785 RepID=A0A165EI56_9APHY|nr:uncharacterized protein LAESUDRAFT_713904 [Laetiporus sulphureus 93-53]KZT07098.1 hypothetical protein LAESUDRAFT_713904 [Laetiporus sulphureus 93-53]